MKTDIGWAVHLRSPGQTASLATFPEHLVWLLKTTCGLRTGLNRAAFQPATRIYIGDEFCPHRLPNVHELDSFFEFAWKAQSSLTLLTPFFTDQDLERCGAVFDHLGRCPVEIEVVANDLGFIRYMKGRYPCLPLAVGRLLNRGFKDPRPHEKTVCQEVSEVPRSLLTDCTFLQSGFQGMLEGLGIKRMERDLLPYEDGQILSVQGFDTSLYFPYGYFTTGRVCWTSSFNRPGSQKFLPRKDCAQPCSSVTFLRSNEGPLTRVVQSGNTFFYEYTLSQLMSLFQSARSRNLRLVYQGYAI